jgi:hypothetical protein
LLENAFADDGDVERFAERLDGLPVVDDDDVTLSAGKFTIKDG